MIPPCELVTLVDQALDACGRRGMLMSVADWLKAGAFVWRPLKAPWRGIGPRVAAALDRAVAAEEALRRKRSEAVLRTYCIALCIGHVDGETARGPSSPTHKSFEKTDHPDLTVIAYLIGQFLHGTPSIRRFWTSSVTRS